MAAVPTPADAVRIAELEERLREAHETLDAIRQGEIDAVVMEGAGGHRVYTLETADRPYRLLIERMQEGALTLSSAGDILYCNPYFADLLGLELQDVTGRKLQRFVAPADHAALDRLIVPSGIADSLRAAVEVALLPLDGAPIAANLSVVDLLQEPGSPRMMCAVITDLRPVKQRARELRDTVQQLREETAVRQAAELDRERLALLVEESSDFIGLADLQGHPIYVNAAGRRLIGLPPGPGGLPPQLGHGVLDFLIPREQMRHTGRVLPPAMRDGRWSGESAFRHLVTGTSIPVAQDVFVLTNRASGEVMNIATIARDLTDQKRIEEQLRQSQKMEAVGQLTGGIAHDFNNLLMGIMGSLELLQTRLAQKRFDQFEHYLKAAASSAARAAAMTQRLLAFSRRQPLTPRDVDANALVASMEELLRRTLGPETTLTILPGEALWSTRCDANQLENVLLNLVINARDAMPDGGALEIACANLEIADINTGTGMHTGAARGRDIPPGRYVVMSVRDTGCGMTPAVMARAFDPFFTTKPLGHGTGLGLSMIYGFVKQSDGHVRLTSVPGGGTTVFLYLPAAELSAGAGAGAGADGAEAAPPAAAVPVAGETVLVVEDEPAIRQLVVEVLGEMGLRTIEAADGPAGLRLLQSYTQIDLLLTDVGLPGLSGRQLAEAARAERPDLKVLFMTGYAEEPLFTATEAEANMQMITKPFAIGALQSRVREMIRP